MAAHVPCCVLGLKSHLQPEKVLGVASWLESAVPEGLSVRGTSLRRQEEQGMGSARALWCSTAGFLQKAQCKSKHLALSCSSWAVPAQGTPRANGICSSCKSASLHPGPGSENSACLAGWEGMMQCGLLGWCVDRVMLTCRGSAHWLLLRG